MGKVCASKRLKKSNIRLTELNRKKLIKKYEEAAAVLSITTMDDSSISTRAKKIKLARAKFRDEAESAMITGKENDLDDYRNNNVLNELSLDNFPFENVNIIISIEIISNLVNRLSCPSCFLVGQFSSKVTQRRGLVYIIKFTCSCDFEISITNSKQLNHSSNTRMDELNMMACVAANVVGIKRTCMATMLGMLNILPPVQIENWNRYNKNYTNALSVVKDKSLEMAGKVFFSNFF